MSKFTKIVTNAVLAGLAPVNIAPIGQNYNHRAPIGQNYNHSRWPNSCTARAAVLVS